MMGDYFEREAYRLGRKLARMTAGSFDERALNDDAAEKAENDKRGERALAHLKPLLSDPGEFA